jgi:hypothetical protein
MNKSWCYYVTYDNRGIHQQGSATYASHVLNQALFPEIQEENICYAQNWKVCRKEKKNADTTRQKEPLIAK